MNSTNSDYTYIDLASTDQLLIDEDRGHYSNSTYIQTSNDIGEIYATLQRTSGAKICSTLNIRAANNMEVDIAITKDTQKGRFEFSLNPMMNQIKVEKNDKLLELIKLDV